MTFPWLAQIHRRYSRDAEGARRREQPGGSVLARYLLIEPFQLLSHAPDGKLPELRLATQALPARPHQIKFSRQLGRVGRRQITALNAFNSLGHVSHVH